jgi:aminopeptidase YwaD
MGLAPAAGARSYFQEFSFHASRPTKPWDVLGSRNVIGRIEGADPSLKNEIVVVGAHYDGQGRTGQADPFRFTSSADSAEDEIWNSANDNAASVAALLEIARAITRNATAPRRSVLFIAFGAEEHGMSGSIHYVAHPVAPLTDHVAMLNLEKIGRGAGQSFNTTANATSSAWEEVLETGRQQAAAQTTTTNPFAIPDSDHYPFAASGVPALMLYISAAPDGHLRSDTADRIDFGRAAHAARLALAMTLDLANRPQRLPYVAGPLLDPGLSAHLASAAEADARGVAAPYGGLKVTGVITGLPAHKAGLQPGDLIVEIAKQQFRRDDQLSALMAMMREVLEGKRGATLPVTVIRGAARLELVINLR